MASSQYPLQIPNELMQELDSVAGATGLSKADVMRQSMKLGLPKLLKQLKANRGRITNVEPLPKAVLKRLYAQRDDDEESIRMFMAAQAKSIQE